MYVSMYGRQVFARTLVGTINSNPHCVSSQSFENHLRGRAHQLMMEKLDESYKLKVDLMRHELRVAEEQRELSLNNSKRRGKKVKLISFSRKSEYTFRVRHRVYLQTSDRRSRSTSTSGSIARCAT